MGRPLGAASVYIGMLTVTELELSFWSVFVLVVCYISFQKDVGDSRGSFDTREGKLNF